MANPATADADQPNESSFDSGRAASGSLRTCVREQNGAVRLFVNDQPVTGLALSHNGFYRADRVQNAYDDFKLFSEAGMHKFRAWAMIYPRADGSLDTDDFDRQMATLLEIDPQMLLMARILRRVPAWWADKHPEELMVHRDAITGEIVPPKPHKRIPAFSSTIWRRDMAGWVKDIVTYCEEKYSRHIFAYFYHGGVIEWAYSWNNLLSDYSRPQRNGFRLWLRQRYEDDANALRNAWQMNEIDFENAEIPLDRTRASGDTGALLDPAKDQHIIDYLTYHSEVAADACVEVAGVFRRTLRSLGAEKIVGTWYGFDFWPAGHPAHVHNSGHHAIQKVLECPDIDFLGLIHSHQERTPGGIWLQHFAASSITAHGKLIYEEEDTATHLAEEEMSWQQVCPDLRCTIGVLTRNFAGTQSVSGSEYWHDYSGEHWFGEPSVVGHVRKLAALAEAELDKPFVPRAEIAVFTSKDSIRYFRQDAALTDAVFSRQISELSHLGAPIDIFYVEDVPLLVRNQVIDRYRVFVFMNCFFLPQPIRQAIAEHLASDDRTLIWLYGAGFITPDGFSADAMTDLTKVPVEIRRTAQPLKASTHITGTLIQYGANASLSPVIVGSPGAEADIQIWGHYLQPDAPAMLERQLPSWRSIWSGAPAVPAIVLRKMVQDAGVHIYADSGDQVFAWNDLFALHASFDGRRTVRLPRLANVLDVLSDKPAAQSCCEVAVRMKRGDSAIWRIHALE